MLNQKMPPVTKFLLIANTAVFFISGTLFLSPEAVQAFYFTFGLVPGNFWQGMVWQPVSSMFLHGGFLHILVNMIALWSLGMLLERAIGSRAFAYLYGFAGIAGGLFVAVFQSSLSMPTVGASGAISGMLGAIAILFPESRLLLFVFPVKARTAAILLGASSILFAMIDGGSNISHLGHLGGLVGGLTYAYFAIDRRRGSGSIFGDFGSADSFSGPRPNPTGWNPFGGSSRRPTGFDTPRPAQGGVTYYDPMRGMFFTVDQDHPLHNDGNQGLFNRDQREALRRIQRILGQNARDDADGTFDEVNGIRFHRPNRRYYN